MYIKTTHVGYQKMATNIWDLETKKFGDPQTTFSSNTFGNDTYITADDPEKRLLMENTLKELGIDYTVTDSRPNSILDSFG